LKGSGADRLSIASSDFGQISLAFPANRSDRCRHAVITAKGETS